MRRWTSLPGIRIALAAVITLASMAAFMPEVAQAVVLNQTIVRLDTLKQNTASTGSVCVEPHVTETTAANVAVTFPTAFTINSSTPATNWAATNAPPGGLAGGQNYWPSGANNWPQATLTPTVVGKTVTWAFTASTFTVGQIYCFRWTSTGGLTSNGAAAASEEGSVALQDATPTTLETNNFAVTILSPSDQVSVNATVPPIFTFTLSTNAVLVPAGGGNMDYTVVNHSDPVDAAVTTNAKGGWIMWAKDDNQGLTSTSTSVHIPSVTWLTGPNRPTALSPGSSGTPGNALSVITRPAVTTYCSTSNLSVDPEYDTVSNAGTDGGPLTSNFAEIGKCTGGVSAGDGLRLVDNVAITPITAAASDYADVLYVIGAGNF